MIETGRTHELSLAFQFCHLISNAQSSRSASLACWQTECAEAFQAETDPLTAEEG